MFRSVRGRRSTAPRTEERNGLWMWKRMRRSGTFPTTCGGEAAPGEGRGAAAGGRRRLGVRPPSPRADSVAVAREAAGRAGTEVVCLDSGIRRGRLLRRSRRGTRFRPGAGRLEDGFDRSRRLHHRRSGRFRNRFGLCFLWRVVFHRRPEACNRSGILSAFSDVYAFDPPPARLAAVVQDGDGRGEAGGSKTWVGFQASTLRPAEVRRRPYRGSDLETGLRARTESRRTFAGACNKVESIWFRVVSTPAIRRAAAIRTTAMGVGEKSNMDVSLWTLRRGLVSLFRGRFDAIVRIWFSLRFSMHEAARGWSGAYVFRHSPVKEAAPADARGSCVVGLEQDALQDVFPPAGWSRRFDVVLLRLACAPQGEFCGESFQDVDRPIGRRRMMSKF